jgi:hypothetical protein
MDVSLQDSDVRDMLHSWMFDLHRAGRSLSSQTQREIEQIALLVVGAGGTMRDAFSAARSILDHPALVSEGV